MYECCIISSSSQELATRTCGAIFKPSERVVKSDCVRFKLQTCLFLLGQSFLPFGVAVFIAAAAALFTLRRWSSFIPEVLDCQRKMLSVCQKTR